MQDKDKRQNVHVDVIPGYISSRTASRAHSDHRKGKRKGEGRGRGVRRLELKAQVSA